MGKPTLLLYNFSQGEVLQLQTLLGFLKDVRVIPVAPDGYGMTIRDVLEGKTPPALAQKGRLDRKLLVLSEASGPMLELLLSAAAQATKGQKLLRALVTETNLDWTGAYLHDHLIEEEAELQKYIK